MRTINVHLFPHAAWSLSCYRCGALSQNAREILDCLSGSETVEECAAGEACVVFKRLYKKGSGESEKGA